MRSSGGKLGRIYGLPKIHKSNIPLRPIVSCIGTVNENLSKYLCTILKDLTRNDYTVYDSFSFCSDVQNLQINDGFVMASFDVTSLFTNVPVDYTINIILDYIYVDKRIDCKIKRDDFRKLLKKAITSQFVFNDVIYEQIDGCPMGNALSTYFANIFMCHLEENLVEISPKLIFYKRYIDDIFTVISTDYLEEFFNLMNNFHPAIKFTLELENAGTLPFLDVNIKRLLNSSRSSGITTELYRKPTFTGLMMNWESWCPRKHKLSAIKGLHERARRICESDPSFKKEIYVIECMY